MPYGIQAKQREYQRKWIAKRRKAYLASKVCCRCGRKRNLGLKRLTGEMPTRRIWTMAMDKMERFLKAFQVICDSCRKLKPHEIPQVVKRQRKAAPEAPRGPRLIASSCPGGGYHTPAPINDSAWAAWARLMEIHGRQQTACPKCGKYLVWR